MSSRARAASRPPTPGGHRIPGCTDTGNRTARVRPDHGHRAGLSRHGLVPAGHRPVGDSRRRPHIPARHCTAAPQPRHASHRAALRHPAHPVLRTPATARPRTDAHRTAPPPGVPCRRAAPAPGRAGVLSPILAEGAAAHGPDRRARAAADGHRRRPAPRHRVGHRRPGTHPVGPCPAGAVVDGPTGPGDRLTPRPVPRPAGRGSTLTAVRTHRDRRTAPHSTSDAPPTAPPTPPHAPPGAPPILPVHAALTEEL